MLVPVPIHWKSTNTAEGDLNFLCGVARRHDPILKFLVSKTTINQNKKLENNKLLNAFLDWQKNL